MVTKKKEGSEIQNLKPHELKLLKESMTAASASMDVYTDELLKIKSTLTVLIKTNKKMKSVFKEMSDLL